MNDITLNQNKPEFIQLLKAQRTAYTISKNCSITEYLIISISMIFPLILIFIPSLNQQSSVVILSGLLMIASILLDSLMKNKTSIAAKIQEQFDNSLFKLAWNNLLCENKVENEDIIRLAQKYKKSDLTDWYSLEIKKELEHEIAVLFCQKTNVFWDKDLRKKYSVALYLILGLYYLTIITIGFIKNLPFESFTLIFLPSLTFLKFQIQLISNQKEVIMKKERIIGKINSLLSNYKIDKSVPDYSDLREIQNSIYSLRVHVNKIPNWFYRYFKDSYELLTDSSIKMKINEIK
ncbi:S-4TM family putative pore-forming effector [Marinifilum sp. RC60d5]|uniref:S-4TM family putative pore-forming effector n=1 Tax=Marinifilum sp. RC60d5 TaxID=3458414 RepID=UPI0040370C05